MITLDDTDRRILLALDREERATVAKLAMDLGLARGTVHSRLDKLGAAGALRPHSTRVPPSGVGLPMRAMVTAGVEQSEFEDLIDDLSQIPEVIECLGISGEADLMIQVGVRDSDHLYSVTQQIMRCRGIRRTATSIVLRELLPYRMDHLLR